MMVSMKNKSTFKNMQRTVEQSLLEIIFIGRIVNDSQTSY